MKKIIDRLKYEITETPLSAQIVVLICPFVLAFVIICAIPFFQNRIKNIDPAVTVTSTDNSDSISIATSTYKYGDITFQILNEMQSDFPVAIGATLNVFQNDKKVLSQSGNAFYVLGFECPLDKTDDSCDPDSSPTFGVDVTGNGGKDFVIVDSLQGGDSEWDNYHIFELPKDGGILKEVASIKGTDDQGVDGGAAFKKLSSGRFVVELADDTFRFWNTDGVHSPWPEIALSFQGGQYRLDSQIMRSNAPALSALKKEAAKWTADNWNYGACAPDTDVCSVWWGYVLDLIYSGNAKSAKTWLDLVWKPNKTFYSEDYFINQLNEQLKQSPYYSAILTLNGGIVF